MSKVLTKKATGRQRVRVHGAGQYDWEDADGGGVQYLTFQGSSNAKNAINYCILPPGHLGLALLTVDWDTYARSGAPPIDSRLMQITQFMEHPGDDDGDGTIVTRQFDEPTVLGVSVQGHPTFAELDLNMDLAARVGEGFGLLGGTRLLKLRLELQNEDGPPGISYFLVVAFTPAP